jgi:hypothetical protein
VPTIFPFSKLTAVRVLAFSRFRRISLAQLGEDCAPPAVRGIVGSFRLSNMAVRNAFRNCSLIVTVASAAGPVAARRSRLALDSCAITERETISSINVANSTLSFIRGPLVEIWSAPAERSGDGALDEPLTTNGKSKALSGYTCHRTSRITIHS